MCSKNDPKNEFKMIAPKDLSHSSFQNLTKTAEAMLVDYVNTYNTMSRNYESFRLYLSTTLN